MIAIRTFIVLLTTTGLTLIGGCSKKQKTAMQQQELATELQATLDTKAWREAIECLEQLIARYPDHKQIAGYKLQLADLYMTTNKHRLAQELYKNYYQLYPSDAKAEYARYQAIMCQAKQARTADRDQTATRKMIELGNAYLNNKVLQTYRTAVAALVEEYEHRLIESELNVFDFYHRRRHTEAAKKRLDYVRTTYLTKYPDLAPRLTLCEQKISPLIPTKAQSV